MNNHEAVIDCRHLAKSYGDSGQAVVVLKDVNLTVQRGERIAVMGRSGAGKSTLLHLLGGLDTPSSGEVRLAGQTLANLAPGPCGQLRNQMLGFVYQFHHLLPEFTALENVAMPLLIRGELPGQAAAQAQQMLARVGLAERIQHKPAQLSGGERQRVALARALVTRPACLLADEPTGNLDNYNSRIIIELLMNLNVEYNTAIVLVTHDQEIARSMQRICHLEDGVLVAA